MVAGVLPDFEAELGWQAGEGVEGVFGPVYLEAQALEVVGNARGCAVGFGCEDGGYCLGEVGEEDEGEEGEGHLAGGTACCLPFELLSERHYESGCGFAVKLLFV